MTWAMVIPLIAEYGIPWAFEFFKIVAKHPTPTPEAWEELLALSQKTMEEYIAEAQAHNN